MAQNHVIKASKKTLVEMITVYQPNRLSKMVSYTVFMAKVSTTTITACQSGKVMFQGPQAEKEAACWEGASTTPKKKTFPQIATLSVDFDNWSVIDSDEVGNGSYSDPAAVCAAYVDKSMISRLKALGVRDSRELIDSRIIQLSCTTRELVPYELLIAEPKKYNEIQLNYSAIHMKVTLRNQAIYLLLQESASTKPEGILIDQFTPEENYRKYVRNRKNQVTEKPFFVIKEEQYYVAAAAASVISRAAFLEELDKESAELDFSVSSDTGNKSDQVTTHISKRDGLDLLVNCVKLYFANTQKT